MTDKIQPRHLHLVIKLGMSHRFRGYSLTLAERAELADLDAQIDLSGIERTAMVELRCGSLNEAEMAKFCGTSPAETVKALESLLERGLARRLKHDGLPALWCEP